MRRLPRVAVVTGTEVTRKCLTEQLVSLIGDVVNVEGYALDEGVEGQITADLILVSSSVVTLEEPFKQHVSDSTPRIIARRMINFSGLHKLVTLPQGTVALLVNDVERSAIESIISLQQLGLDHIRYIPYSPKSLTVPAVDVAVTPGEVEFVPAEIETVIDIGPRLLDLTTALEILSFFGAPLDINISLSESYMKEMVQLSRRFAQQIDHLEQQNRTLNGYLDGVGVGIISLDNNNEVQYANAKAKELIGLQNLKFIDCPNEQYLQESYSIANQRTLDGARVITLISKSDLKSLESEVPYPSFADEMLDELVSDWEQSNDAELYNRILQLVAMHNKSGDTIGRKTLSDLSQSHIGTNISEQQARQLLDQLEEWGLVKKKRGRHGTRITDKGKKILHILSD